MTSREPLSACLCLTMRSASASRSINPEGEAEALGRGVVPGEDPAQGVGIHDVDGPGREMEALPDEGRETVR